MEKEKKIYQTTNELYVTEKKNIWQKKRSRLVKSKNEIEAKYS